MEYHRSSQMDYEEHECVLSHYRIHGSKAAAQCSKCALRR